MNPGSIVRCRQRDWVLLPSDTQDVYRLRPLAPLSLVPFGTGQSDHCGPPEPRVRRQSVCCDAHGNRVCHRVRCRLRPRNPH